MIKYHYFVFLPDTLLQTLQEKQKGVPRPVTIAILDATSVLTKQPNKTTHFNIQQTSHLR